ncbi:MAG: nucleoside triphosphate pyrophosphohydrolase family protein [Candidatus Magasanikbacteria bacterium]|nr:nucleoside triphosphate pyrophosphohydrolase family protein [Candidatus Magasanikbacteria bacterium]MCA9390784.1 nucleoside triphosphate pyrophosphohydrolase family protein [Candidatus Magasanikbacteria bacterium]USN52513.1 MAG: nucleoside triphosphate pyrophosphohydrolase family protein [Candidatus Nomurabacteria bacterium]HPF95751.1 nucleoside triphosphate pyrophosphohydrolase family protein [bacterium]
MTLNDYQNAATKTALYPESGNNLLYPILGLCGESGELAEKMKKMIRDDQGVLTEERRQLMVKELGDVLWYVSQVARELGISLEEVGQMNVDKLASRMDRDVLHGNGDLR